MPFYRLATTAAVVGKLATIHRQRRTTPRADSLPNAFARIVPITIPTVLLSSLSAAATTLRLAPVVVDSEMAGDIKAVCDIDGDGNPDVFGANWTGHPPARLWLNHTNPSRHPIPLSQWAPLMVSRQHHRTFGIGFGDMDGDFDDDIVSGRFVYFNPGADMSDTWPRIQLPRDMHASAALDVDLDDQAGLIAQRQEADIGVYWLEISTDWFRQWRATRVGEVPRASHTLGAQGYAVADVVPGGLPEVLLSMETGVWTPL